MNADIVILTPIAIEYEAVKNLLRAAHLMNHPISGQTYLSAKVKTRRANYHVVLRKTGSGNLKIMNAVHQTVKDFDPKVILLTGTAGGLKKVKIGDLIIGHKAYNYEAGRENEGSFSSRPDALMASNDLVELADKIAQEEHWKTNLPDSEDINYYIKPIVSGEKVIETVDNYLYKRIRHHYDDAVALEMEAAGFLEAATAYPSIKVLNIRSISDLLEDKAASNKAGSRERAAQVAAAFTMELIHNLAIKKFRAAPVIFRSALVGLFVFFMFFLSREGKSIDEGLIETPISTNSPNEELEIQKDTSNNEERKESEGNKQQLEGLKIAEAVSKETKPQVNPIKKDIDTVIQKIMTFTKPETVLIDSLMTVVSPPIMEESKEGLPTHKVKQFIHVFDTNDLLVFGVQYELEGEFLGDDIRHLDLMPDSTYTLKLRHGNMEYTRKIKGSKHNNQELPIYLKHFTPIITH